MLFFGAIDVLIWFLHGDNKATISKSSYSSFHKKPFSNDTLETQGAKASSGARAKRSSKAYKESPEFILWHVQAEINKEPGKNKEN